jgi:hypothetical protein
MVENDLSFLAGLEPKVRHVCEKLLWLGLLEHIYVGIPSTAL